MDKMNMTMPGMSGGSKFSLTISQRFWLSLILCLPILALNLIGDFTNWEKGISADKVYNIEMVLSTLTVWICGSMFFSKAWSGLKKGQLNMFTLISLAVFTAWFYSLFALLIPEFFPREFQIFDGVVPVYFDAAAYVTFLVLWGHYVEMRAKMEINTDILKQTEGKIAVADKEILAKALNENAEMEMPMQKTIDKIAGYFVLAVIVFALGAFIYWRLNGPMPSGAFALEAAISVLLAACPCALSLASPLSVTIAVNKAAAKNMLIKNAGILEQIHQGADVVELQKSKKLVLLNKSSGDDLAMAEAILVPPYATDEELTGLADKVIRNIHENLALGILYNVIMIPLAAGALYPLWGVMVGPVIASAAMSISSAVVIANAFRLKTEL